MLGKSRKCVKCSASSAQDPKLMLHRFPKPGKENGHRMAAWAKYCYPEDNWNSSEFQKKLWSSHKMLCSKHFSENAFVTNHLQRQVMHRYAIPCDSAETSPYEIQVSSEADLIQIIELNQPLKSMEVVFTASGLMPPVFTPLNDDQTINFEVIPGYAEFLAKAGIKSVLVGGTTGEHMSLSVSARKMVIDEWVKAGKATGLHIMVQVGGAPFVDVVALADYCSNAGVDSLLTLPELYFKPASVDDLVSYVESVASAAPNLPVLYYHIPSMTKVEINMPAFVAAATARIPNFKGIKFTSNDLSEGAQVMRNLKKGQKMFLGADTLLAPAALLGITSSIGTSYNLFPRLAQDILDAVSQGHVLRARVLQEKLSLAIEAHTAEGPWVPIMKAGMEIVTGINVGPPSMPQKELSPEAKERIANKLKALKLIS